MLSDKIGHSFFPCCSRCKGQIELVNNKHGCFPSLSSLTACFLCISLMYSWIPGQASFATQRIQLKLKAGHVLCLIDILEVEYVTLRWPRLSVPQWLWCLVQQLSLSALGGGKVKSLLCLCLHGTYTRVEY